MKEQLFFDITNLVTVVFEAFVVHMFLSEFLGQKDEYKKAIKYARLGFMICLGVCNLITLNPAITIPLIIILIFSSSFLYEGNIKIRLFTTVLLNAFFILSELVASCIVVLFIKEGIEVMFEGSNIRIYSVVLSKLIFLIMCKVVCFFKRDVHSDIPIKCWIPLLMIPLFSVFLIISIFDIDNSSLNINVNLKIIELISAIGILYINFAIFYLFKTIIENTRLSMQYEMLEKEVEYKEDLRLSNERYKIIVEQTDSVVFEWNIKENKSFISQNWLEKFGYNNICDNLLKEVRDKDLVHHEDYNIFENFFYNVKNGNTYNKAIYRLRKSNGDYIWCRTSTTNIYDSDGDLLKIVGVIVDIDSDTKRYESLKIKAERDSLTGVYNKGAFEDLVRKSMILDKLDKKNALFIIDLDDFKEINDNFGHPFGDFVLKTVAKRIQANFENIDLIGRIGGDEFVAYMHDYGAEININNKALKLNEILSDDYSDSTFTFKASVSIGIAKYPQDGTSFLDLFKNADRALYDVKESGKNSYCIFGENVHMESIL